MGDRAGSIPVIRIKPRNESFGAFLLLGQGPVFIAEFFVDPKNEALKTIIPLAMRVVELL